MNTYFKISISLFLTIITIFMAHNTVFAYNVNSATLFNAYASTGGEIKLIDNFTLTDNVDINNDLIIDLNGYSLNLGGYVINVYGPTTILDTSNDKNGEIKCTATRASASYAFKIDAAASLTIESGALNINDHAIRNYGSFIMNGGSVICSQNYAARNESGAKFTINDGIISAGVYCIQDNGGEIFVNGGEVKGTSQNANGYSMSIYNKGTLTIDGGKVSAVASMSVYSLANSKTYLKNGIISAANSFALYGAANSEIIITNGTITSKKQGLYNSGKTVINGGLIEGTVSQALYNNINALVEMNGGIITSPSTVIGSSSSHDCTLYNAGTFKMYDGTIHSDEGFGVYGITDSVFTMDDGLVEILSSAEAIRLSKPGAKAIINGGSIKALSENGAGIVAFKDTEITINGGEIDSYGSCILGNGSGAEGSDGRNAIFTINGGTLTSNIGAGIYAPQQNGITTINGGKISGTTGIEVRAGTLIITSGDIVATADYEANNNTNGIATKGAAVSIAQHTTKKPIEVKISGGTFTGKLPISQENKIGNSDSDLEQITLSIEGGSFISTGDKTVYIADCGNDGPIEGGFITGGSFTHYVTPECNTSNPYVSVGYGEIKNSNGMIEVKKYGKTKLNYSSDYGTTILTRNDDESRFIVQSGDVIIIETGEIIGTEFNSLPGNKITVTATPSGDAELLAIIVMDENLNTITVDSSNSYYATSGDTEINVFYSLPKSREINPNIEALSGDAGVDSKTTTNEILINTLKQNEEIIEYIVSNSLTSVIEVVITEEREIINEIKEDVLTKINTEEAYILPYDISIVVKDENENEIARLSETNEEIKIIIMLPQEILDIADHCTREYYVVRKHNGNFELLKATISEDGKSISFKSNLFSTYAIAFTESATKYSVKFINDDGAVLQSGEYVYGATPIYSGDVPTKEATKDYKYTFKEWTPDIVAVSGDAIYTATYEEEKIKKKSSGGGSGSSSSIKKDTENIGDNKEYTDNSLLVKDNHISYIVGYEDRTFKPENNMTRAEVVTIFTRLLKKQPNEESDSNPFTDIEEHWAKKYILALGDLGIINGYEDGSFKPDKSITRAEFVNIVSRLEGKISLELNNIFTDLNSNHWAYTSILYSKEMGWVLGYEDGTFKPDKNITRAEVVTIINRLLIRSKFVDYNKFGINPFDDIDETHWAYYQILEAYYSHDYKRYEDSSEEWTLIK